MRRKAGCAFGVLLVLACHKSQAQICSVSGNAVAFGNYQPLGGPTVTTTGTVTVTCQPVIIALNVMYTIALGTGGGGSFAARSMGGATPRLGYQLFRDSGYTQIWGDGTAGTYTVTDGYALSLIFPITRTYSVYGQILSGTAGRVGSYTDSVMITITY